MKRKAFIFILLAILLLSACGAETFDPAGTYTDDMGSDLIITADGGGYKVNYSIYKLTYMGGAEGTFDADSKILSFAGTDYDGNALAANVDFSGENPIVTLTKSSYSDCPAGTVFEFHKK